MHQHFICGELCLKTTICSVFISVLHLSLSAVVIVNCEVPLAFAHCAGILDYI